jgi:hypothetical protein
VCVCVCVYIYIYIYRVFQTALPWNEVTRYEMTWRKQRPTPRPECADLRNRVLHGLSFAAITLRRAFQCPCPLRDNQDLPIPNAQCQVTRLDYISMENISSRSASIFMVRLSLASWWLLAWFIRRLLKMKPECSSEMSVNLYTGSCRIVAPCCTVSTYYSLICHVLHEWHTHIDTHNRTFETLQELNTR